LSFEFGGDDSDNEVPEGSELVGSDMVNPGESSVTKPPSPLRSSFESGEDGYADNGDELAEGGELGDANVVGPEERIPIKPFHGEQFNTFRAEKRKRYDSSDSESEVLKGSGEIAGMKGKRRSKLDDGATSSRATKRVRAESTDDDDPSDGDSPFRMESVKRRAFDDIRDLGNQKRRRGNEDSQ
jgi:hypothetical protein